MQKAYGTRGFIVVAVNGYDEPRDVVKKFVDAKKLRQTVLLEGSQVAETLYGVTGYPTSFWIDHRGKVLRRETGFSEIRFRHMKARAERLLKQRGE